jgi:hypothetical protein
VCRDVGQPVAREPTPDTVPNHVHRVGAVGARIGREKRLFGPHEGAIAGSAPTGRLTTLLHSDGAVRQDSGARWRAGAKLVPGSTRKRHVRG